MPTNKKIVSKFVDLQGVPNDMLQEAAEEVGEFLITQILEDAGKGKSSVNGRKWKSLSSKYISEKKKISGSSSANLELNGDLLDDLDWRLKGKRVEIGWFGEKEQILKAYNHNTGDTLPKRQSIPKPSENFRPGIRKEIDQIIDEILEDDDGG